MHFFTISVILSQSDVSDKHIVITLASMTEDVSFAHSDLHIFDLFVGTLKPVDLIAA